MSAAQLTVLMSGRTAGHVTRAAGGGPLVFTYHEPYAHGPAAVPLSLSMPLTRRRFADARVQGWMEGLLPGHSRVRSHWAAKHGAASVEPFDLLATKVGLECAGAVQFCGPDTLADADAGQPGGVDWLTPAQTEEMVVDMVRNAWLWGRHLRSSAFSLAGAFAKTALYRDSTEARRWGEPHGSHPSTHILKVPMPGQPEQSINEHLCLATARYAGLDAAETELQTWAGHTAVVVTRFDRVRDAGGGLRRVHQEDLHQAVGDYRASIYQRATTGRTPGHDPARLARLLRDHSTEPARDTAAFFDALAFNWLICNTDAHSKNYSILLGVRAARLAPLYDIWSVMPEDPHHYQAHSLAMSALADPRILAGDNPQAWRTTAAAVGLDEAVGVHRVERIARAIPQALERAVDELHPQHRAAAVVAALASMVPERTSKCLSALAATKA